MPVTKVLRRAWALLDDGEGSDPSGLALHDGRLPLFWHRDVAVLFNRQHFEDTARIARVEVRLVTPKRKSVERG